MRVLNQSPSCTSLCWVVQPGTCGVAGLAWHLCVKGTFRLVDGGVAAPVEEEPEGPCGDKPNPAGDDLGIYYPSDFGPCKERGEILVVGTAFPPADSQVSSFEAGFQAGPIKKDLTLFGPREWKVGFLSSEAGLPGPATPVPLSYARSFGGKAWPWNPMGTGRDGLAMHQIESPGRRVLNPQDEAAPAGTGPIPADWQIRRELMGRFDGDYAKTRWPWWPEGFNAAYFHVALPDQRLPGFWKGNEELTFQGMHPELPVLRSALPGLLPRCFIRKSAPKVPGAPAGELHSEEVAMNLETVWADPSKSKLILSWRGQVPVSSVKFPEIQSLWVRLEPLGAEGGAGDAAERDLCGFEAAAAVALASRGLPAAPPPAVPAQASADPVDELFQSIHELTSSVKPPSPEPSAEIQAAERDLDEVLARLQANDEAARKIAEAEQLRAQAERGEPAENPVGDALAATAARKAELEKKFAEIEASIPGTPTWRDFASDGKIDAEALRGGSVSGMDFRDAPVAGADLSRIDLAGAIFSGADLSQTRFEKSNLSGADFAGCLLSATDFSGANLSGAKFAASDVKSIRWAGAMCGGATFSGLDLEAIDWANFLAPNARFLGCKMAGSNLSSALLVEAEFPDCDLTQACLQEAMLSGADLRGSRAPGANFSEAKIDGLRTDAETDLTGAIFVGALGAGAIFENCKLEGAHFTKADLQNARFVDVAASGANFERADLRKATCDDSNFQAASFTHANAMKATFDRSDCQQVVFDHANLFSASFWETKTSHVSWTGAFLARTRFDPETAP